MQWSSFSQGWETNEVEIANSSREKLLAILGITAVSHGWFIVSLTVAYLAGSNTNEPLMGAPSLAQSSRTANEGTWGATQAKQARQSEGRVKENRQAEADSSVLSCFLSFLAFASIIASTHLNLVASSFVLHFMLRCTLGMRQQEPTRESASSPTVYLTQRL